MTKINLINTNARSLRPKKESLLDCFNETDADFAVLTETWLRDEHVQELAQDLTLGSGLGIVTKNRPPCNNGVAYGGVGVVWRQAVGNFKEFVFRNPERFEILATAGSIRGHKRKFVIIGCYIPPGYTKQRGACLLYTSPSPRDRQKSRMPSSA